MDSSGSLRAMVTNSSASSITKTTGLWRWYTTYWRDLISLAFVRPLTFNVPTALCKWSIRLGALPEDGNFRRMVLPWKLDEAQSHFGTTVSFRDQQNEAPQPSLTSSQLSCRGPRTLMAEFLTGRRVASRTAGTEWETPQWSVRNKKCPMPPFHDSHPDNRSFSPLTFGQLPTAQMPIKTPETGGGGGGILWSSIVPPPWQFTDGVHTHFKHLHWAFKCKALRYKPEGRQFDSRWRSEIFHRRNSSGRTMAVVSTQKWVPRNLPGK